MRHLGLAMVMWPVLQGCTALDRDDSFTIRRDSAGVRIVEARQPAWGVGDGWQIDPEPLLDLTESGTGDPHNFYQVRGMRRLPDGSIVVANAGSREVRLFSPEGSFLGSIGGPGEGPGEFANMQQLEIVGDSMFVLDYDGRVTVFGPAPALVRAMRFHHGVESIQSLGDGSLVAEVLLSIPDPVSAGVLRTPLALLRLDLEGTRLDSIGETAGYEEYTDNVSFSGTPLFPKRSHVDAHDGRILYGTSDFMQVQELAPNGEVVRIFRIPDYPLALTDKQVQAERRRPPQRATSRGHVTSPADPSGDRVHAVSRDPARLLRPDRGCERRDLVETLRRGRRGWWTNGVAGAGRRRSMARRRRGTGRLQDLGDRDGRDPRNVGG